MYVGRVGIKGVVGVIGGSDTTGETAKELGKRLAELQSVHLLTSGDGTVSEGFYGVHPRGGIILSVVPKGKSPGDFVEIPILTHLNGADATAADSPSHLTALNADVIVALPGAEDTLGLLEVATKAKYKYGKPAIIYLPDTADTVAGKNAAALKRAKYTVTDNLDEVVSFVQEALASKG